MVKRLSDGFLLNDADGSFSAAPADPYFSLPQDAALKGIYTATEARTAWTDGEYLIAYYAQLGGSPAPTTDTNITLDPTRFVRSDNLISEGIVSDRLMQTLLPITLGIKKEVGAMANDGSLLKKFEEIRVNISEIFRIVRK